MKLFFLIGYVSKFTSRVSAGGLYYKDQRVQVKYGNHWFDGTVLKIRISDSFKVYY